MRCCRKPGSLLLKGFLPFFDKAGNVLFFVKKEIHGFSDNQEKEL
jgi:hypothetical protein